MASGIRLGHVFFSFGANTAEFDSQMASVNKRLRNFNRAMRPITAAARRLTVAFTAGAGALAYLGRETAEQIDRQSKLAQSLQTSTASVAALERAAELAGIQSRQLETGLRTMSVQLSRLADGSAPTELQDAFEGLGLSAKQLSDLRLDQRLARIQGAITRLIPKAEQAAVGMQIFGSRAALAFARLDPETIRKASFDIERFGGILTEVEANEVERMNDALSSLSTGFAAIRQQIVAGAAPALADFAERLSQSLEAGSDFRRTVAAITTAFAAAAPRVDAYAYAFLGLVASVKALSIATKILSADLVALRAALIRTGVLAGVVIFGEIIHSLQTTESETTAYRESVERLGLAIAGTNRIRQHSLTLSNAEASASRKATEAALANAKARLAEAEAALSARRQAATQTGSYQDALARFTEAARERDALGGKGKAASAFDTHRAEVNRRYQRAAREMRALLDVEGEDRIREIRGGIEYLEGKLAALENQIIVPEAPLHGVGGGSENPEKTRKERQRAHEAAIERIRDAEASLGLETQRRVLAVERQRDQVLESLDEQAIGYEALKERAIAAFDDLERHARGQITVLERIKEAADDLGAHFGDFATELSINFKAIRNEGEALNDLLKTLGMQVARTLSQKAIGDPLSQAISAGVSAGTGALGNFFGGAGTTANPHTRAGGGYARGWTMVGEQGRELAYFGREAKIHSNRRTEQMLAGRRGGAEIGLSVSVSGDLDSITQQIERKLSEAAPQIADATYSMVEQNIGRPSNLRTEAGG